MDSIVSASASMRSLVSGAKEVRRMIREASFDSLASDFSLGDFCQNDIGVSTELNLDLLTYDLSDLKDNVSSMNKAINQIPAEIQMSTSKSENAGLSKILQEETVPGSPRIEGSTPDLRHIDQRPKRHFWKMNYTMNEFDSPAHSGSLTNTEPESLEWESPLHGWHDLKHQKYKVALSSRSASEYGGDDDGLDGLEWDCEGYNPMDETDLDHERLRGHKNWLPESTEGIELDLEAELGSRCGSSSTSRSGSRRTSLDKYFYWNKVRQPPSGRSSVERGCGDNPRQVINQESLIKSFGVFPLGVMQSEQEKVMSTSCVSEESGYQEGMETSGVGSIASASGCLTLSPVHETKEPTSANATPVRKPNPWCESSTCDTVVKRKRLLKKNLFMNEDSVGGSDDRDDESIAVVLNQ